VWAQVQLQATAVPTQVVLLGAGMDTRAWRHDLQLPPGTPPTPHPQQGPA